MRVAEDLPFLAIHNSPKNLPHESRITLRLLFGMWNVTIGFMAFEKWFQVVEVAIILFGKQVRS